MPTRIGWLGCYINTWLSFHCFTHDRFYKYLWNLIEKWNGHRFGTEWPSDRGSYSKSRVPELDPHCDHHPSGHMTSKWRHTNVDATSWRRIDVDMTSFWRHVPAGMLFPWAKYINFLEYWLIPRKLWLRPDMTEELLTGMLNLNKLCKDK